MPVTFTEERVRSAAVWALKMSEEDAKTAPIAELREKLALKSEEEFGDYVEGWEIRTGRPWNEMTPTEARQLIEKRPELRGNPGVLSRLFAR